MGAIFRKESILFKSDGRLSDVPESVEKGLDELFDESRFRQCREGVPQIGSYYWIGRTRLGPV
jgi:hypothetical protein